MISELWSYRCVSYLFLVLKHVSCWLRLLNNERDERNNEKNERNNERDERNNESDERNNERDERNLEVYKKLRRNIFFFRKERRKKEEMDKRCIGMKEEEKCEMKRGKEKCMKEQEAETFSSFSFSFQIF
jgi:hypothetical protein